MRRCLSLALAAVAVPLLTVSCLSDGRVYSHYEDIAGSRWDKSDTVTFRLPRLKAAGEYTPAVMVRTTDNYGYRNLNVVVRLYSDRLVRTDTLTLDIFDRNGMSQGHGLIHTEFSGKLPPVELDTTEYTVSIQSLMTETPLVGVSGVGLTL
ncbi:MAG: gliding motility lipoprotein GldH [Bacteroidaceae bacterium]|nr:gliding motility lipoprotein GldH [Bacteroidaceae bacterium]